MSVLVLDQKGLSLARERDALVVRHPEQERRNYPLKRLSHIVCVQRAVLDTSLLVDLAQRGIVVSLISGRGMSKHALVHAPSTGLVKLRMKQYQVVLNTPQRLGYVRVLLGVKLRKQQKVLEDLRQAYPCERMALSKAMRGIASARQSIRTATCIERLRGHEGAAASAYFGALREVLPKAWGFEGRRKRPPPDPVNALLSLSYSLLHDRLVGQLHGVGLDPLVGVLHDPQHGRASAACDLQEWLRPDIDAWVLNAIRQNHWRPEDFKRSEGGCFLGSEMRALYFSKIHTCFEGLLPQTQRALKRLRRSWELPIEPIDH